MRGLPEAAHTDPLNGRGNHMPAAPSYHVVKRGLDIVLSALSLALTSPILAAVALAVRVKLGRPVLFKQTRPGRFEVPFVLYKFRTMRNERDSKGSLLSDRERLAPFGTLLRRFSIDELPELWNVLRGDMSLVGPRPLLGRYLPYYTDRERTRHSVRPGLTGLAQIEGRNMLGWNERLEADARYVETVSFKSDLKVLAVSVWRVLSGRGVVTDPGAVMADLDTERGARG